MKKILMLVVVAMMATLSASAQDMYIKPMVGANLTKFVGDVSNQKFKVGLVAGAEFGYDVNERFGLTAGLLYAMQGSKTKGADNNTNVDYLNIPVLANVYIVPGLAIKAGPQLGIRTRAKYDDIDLKDNFKAIDFSIPVGLSYEISGFVIDARYNIGVTNIAKDSYGGGKARNSVIQLTLGYKIPF